MESGGQPGNTNATKEHRLITSALKRAVVQNPDALREACLKVLDDAKNGNLAAFREIADRLDGKPAQTQILEGGEKPVTIDGIVRSIVDPKHTDS